MDTKRAKEHMASLLVSCTPMPLENETKVLVA